MADPSPRGAQALSETPKNRKCWQLHLSTVIVLMFLAGGLIWMNSCPCLALSGPYRVSHSSSHIAFFSRPRPALLTWGWPFALRSEEVMLFPKSPDELAPKFERLRNMNVSDSLDWYNEKTMRREEEASSPIILENGILNGATGLALLFVVACIFEYLMRCREGRKP